MAIKFIEPGSAVILTLIDNKIFKEGCTFTNTEFEKSLEKIKKACMQINKYSKNGIYYFIDIEEPNLEQVVSRYNWIVKESQRKEKDKVISKYKLVNVENVMPDCVPYRLGTENELKTHFRLRYGRELYNELFSRYNELAN